MNNLDKAHHKPAFRSGPAKPNGKSAALSHDRPSLWSEESRQILYIEWELCSLGAEAEPTDRLDGPEIDTI